MSLDQYCRECGILFQTQEDLLLHFESHHYGLKQPPPLITQEEFEKINFWSLSKVAQTCPVCLVHYRRMPDLVEHIQNSHPARTSSDPTTHTAPRLLEYWASAVRHRFARDNIGEKLIHNKLHKTCPVCSKVFDSFDRCMRHIFTIHFRRRWQVNQSLKFKKWALYIEQILPDRLVPLMNTIFKEENEAPLLTQQKRLQEAVFSQVRPVFYLK